MEEKKSILNWIKEHKKKLIIAGVSVTAIVGFILAIKNRESIIEIWTSLKRIVESKPETMPSVNNRIVVNSVEATNTTTSIRIQSDVLENLTGNRVTAARLGDKVRCSAQKINKRLVSSGLIERLPCGQYVLTETGKLLGEYTTKTTRSRYTFSNIEWDDSVLGIIFNKNELKEIANKQRLAMEIIDGVAA